MKTERGKNKPIHGTGSDVCLCGHQRKSHGKSHSINFTEGSCSECSCQHFLMPSLKSSKAVQHGPLSADEHHLLQLHIEELEKRTEEAVRLLSEISPAAFASTSNPSNWLNRRDTLLEQLKGEK